MVAKRICLVPVTDLSTIRITIKGITTELPVDFDKLQAFIARQQREGGMSQAAPGAISEFVAGLLGAQGLVSDDFKIEFVIPADQ